MPNEPDCPYMASIKTHSPFIWDEENEWTAILPERKTIIVLRPCPNNSEMRVCCTLEDNREFYAEIGEIEW